MKNKVLKTLEFYKIINMLLDCSQSIIGKKLIKNAEISTDIIKIKKLLDETDEAYRFIMKHKTPAISNIDDLEEDFKLLEVGRFFTIRKLLEVWKLLNTSRFLKNLISSDDEVEYENIFGLLSSLNYAEVPGFPRNVPYLTPGDWPGSPGRPR